MYRQQYLEKKTNIVTFSLSKIVKRWKILLKEKKLLTKKEYIKKTDKNHTINYSLDIIIGDFLFHKFFLMSLYPEFWFWYVWYQELEVTKLEVVPRWATTRDNTVILTTLN